MTNHVTAETERSEAGKCHDVNVNALVVILAINVHKVDLKLAVCMRARRTVQTA